MATKKDKNEKLNPNFHDVEYYGKPHDTYRNQEKYVRSLGNRWAMENFEATRPYFA